MLLKDYLEKTGIGMQELYDKLIAVEPPIARSMNGSRFIQRHRDGLSKPDMDTMNRYFIATNKQVTPDDWRVQFVSESAGG